MKRAVPSTFKGRTHMAQRSKACLHSLHIHLDVRTSVCTANVDEILVYANARIPVT